MHLQQISCKLLYVTGGSFAYLTALYGASLSLI